LLFKEAIFSARIPFKPPAMHLTTSFTLRAQPLFYLIDHAEEADLLALSAVLEGIDEAKNSPFVKFRRGNGITKPN
jgi:hypothetical protein